MASLNGNSVANEHEGLEPVNIKPLLTKLWPNDATIDPSEIADAIAHFFTNQVSDAQAAALLMALHFTGLDYKAEVLAECASAMLKAAAPIPVGELHKLLLTRGRKEGNYHGGLCDIVGTGGDSHNTFNVSTTSSILASALLLVTKHGNRSSTSKSGSADTIDSMKPRAPVIGVVRPDTLVRVLTETNYVFLFATGFHTGMRYVAPIRKQLPWRTIFNNVGPLANPLDSSIEARVIGVGRCDLGPEFAKALQRAGCKKALIVCGEEELDELSCAGRTLCWLLTEKTPGEGETVIEHFMVEPSDFGLKNHPLSDARSGKDPAENAEILRGILHGDLPLDHPVVEFVLINTAALLVVSGICEADSSDMGHGDDGNVIKERGPAGQRWKEGVRRAKWAIQSGEAWRQWQAFVDVTNDINEA